MVKEWKNSKGDDEPVDLDGWLFATSDHLLGWAASPLVFTSKLELRLLGNFSSQYEHMMLRGREVWLLT